jgi:hypothetical protein
MFTLTKPRSATEMQAQAVQVKKSERGSNRDKQKLKSIATRGLEPAFAMTTYSPVDDGDEFAGGNASLGKTYEVERQISNFRNRMVSYDMHEIFELKKIATEGTATTAPVFGADKFDLFEKYENITLDECKEWNAAIREYATEEDVESLVWTAELLFNSTDTSLQTKIGEEFDKLPNNHKGGVVYFKIMMEQIVSSTEDAVQLMLNTLRTMKLTKFQGENVYTAVSQVRGAINRLKSLSVSRVPSDIVHQVITMLTTSSTEEFNEIFKHMLTLSKQETFKLQIGGRTDLAMVESILKDATKNYASIKNADKWIGIDAGASAFAADLSKVQCYNCKKNGHLKRDCPEATEKQRTEWKETARNRTSGGGRGGRGRNGGGRNGGGRGKGRGRGGGNGKNNDKAGGGSKYSPSGQFRRPEAGEDTRTIMGNLCYPCSHCGWNDQHSTANHKGGGSSGQQAASPTPKAPTEGDFAKKVALAIRGIAKAGNADVDADEAPATFSSLSIFSGIEKVLKE